MIYKSGLRLYLPFVFPSGKQVANRQEGMTPEHACS
jgi:hypothetical protein